MKVVTVQIVGRDDQDVAAINSHLEQSGLLNDWPILGWSEEDATPEQIEWFEREYEEVAGT